MFLDKESALSGCSLGKQSTHSELVFSDDANRVGDSSWNLSSNASGHGVIADDDNSLIALKGGSENDPAITFAASRDQA